MRLFPRYWEGSHPAFPKRPSELQSESSIAHESATFGIVSGGAVAGLFALLNRYTPGRAVYYIGIGTFASALFKMATVPYLASRDVTPFLKAEGVPLPKFRLWERTTTWTTDDLFVVGAALGFARALVRPRVASLNKEVSGLHRQPLALWRFLGCVTIGGFGASLPLAMGILPTMPRDRNLQRLQERTIAKIRWMQELAQAKHLYETKSGKPAPPWLYEVRNPSVPGIPILANREGEHPGESHPQLLFSEPNGPEHTLEPMPPGAAPHIAIKVDNDVKFANARDYHWRPESIEDGVQALEEHIKTLSERRLELVREAEYLWLEVAKKEQAYARDKLDDDAESQRRMRAKLELLSSIHMNTYAAIAEFDWMIANAKKMILQLKSDGDWEPAKPKDIDPKTYVPERILEMLKQHKKSTEENRQQWSGLLMAPASEDQKESLNDSSRDAEDNDVATGELVEEFEQRVKDPASFDDGVG